MPRSLSGSIVVDVLKSGRLVYRNRKTGRFASAKAYNKQFKPKRKARLKPKAKVVKPATMWRCTLTCALYKSGQRDHRPEKKTVWAWAMTEAEAVRLARAEFDKMARKYCRHKDWEAWNNPSEGVNQVEYDARLLGTARRGQ